MVFDGGGCGYIGEWLVEHGEGGGSLCNGRVCHCIAWLVWRGRAFPCGT